MEAPSKAFPLFFLLPDWLNLNHLKSRTECGFSEIFSLHICFPVAETIGVTNYAANFGAKKCSENHIWSCWDDSRSMEPIIKRFLRNLFYGWGWKAMSYQTHNQSTEIKQAIHTILISLLLSDSCARILLSVREPVYRNSSCLPLYQLKVVEFLGIYDYRARLTVMKLVCRQMKFIEI